MQACIFDWYFAKQTGQPCDPNNGRQLSQNSFKAWATNKPSVAWYPEHEDMGETWRRLRVDGWTAVSALPKYRGIRMAAGVILNQTRTLLYVLYNSTSPAVERGDNIKPWHFE